MVKKHLPLSKHSKPSIPTNNQYKTTLSIEETEQVSQSRLNLFLNAQSEQTQPSLTPNMLNLQRTIGNRDTLRLIDQPASIVLQPSIQRIMSFDSFQKASGQVKETKSMFGKKTRTNDTAQEDIFTGKTGADNLKNERLNNKVFGTLYVNLNTAYQKYEADPSLSNLIELYDTITYWKMANSTGDLLAQSEMVINNLIAEIKAEVQAETQKLGGGTTKGLAIDQILPPTRPTKQLPGVRPSSQAGERLPKQQGMPEFMRDVGIAESYFDKNIAGKPDIIKNLELYYTSLKAGKLYQAKKAWNAVGLLPGSEFIQSLFLAKFSNQANLGDVVNTDKKEKEGQQLTTEEREAILKYTGLEYKAMNEQLRGSDTRATGPMIGKNTPKANSKHNTDNLTVGKMSGDAAQKIDQDSARMTTMKLAVSGLNKLPKYEGLLYRIMINPPSEFLKGISKGGISTNLGFSSASPSMKGVGAYEKPLDGKKSIYYIIRVKTAVNVVAMSGIVSEAEILIRPGTRFQVKGVWQHLDGNVPTDAPVEAQMVLHKIGEFKNDDGRVPQAGENKNKVSVIEMDEV